MVCQVRFELLIFILLLLVRSFMSMFGYADAIIPAMRQAVRQSHLFRMILQSLIVLAVGLFLFLVLWLLSITIDQIWHAGRILPGISIAGINVSGLSIDDAAKKLKGNVSLGNSGIITLYYENLPIEFGAENCGIQLDAEASAKKAFDFGRSSPLGSFFAYQFLGRHANHDLTPIVIFNQQAAYIMLRKIAQDYDQPVREADLELSGTQVEMIPSQNGSSLNISASLDKLTAQITHWDLSSISLVVDKHVPDIIDVSSVADSARGILAQPFTLRIPEDQPVVERSFSISPENISLMLTFIKDTQTNQTSLVPQLREDLLTAMLADIAVKVVSRAQNARFIFNDDTHELDLLAAAVEGRKLDILASFTVVQEALKNNENSAELVFNILPPQMGNSATAQELGITELLHEESSYFYGSSTARIQNIETAAAEFHGLLIPPGAVFSMAEVIDDVSLDNGYTEALIIFNGRTIEGVGGGVCQVSTTLFRTAFFAGFPINERHPHAYRVSYYEKTSGNSQDPDLAGLDATVYVPLVDLKFTNDTPYWLLMETYVSPSANRITWKFYSSSDNRMVEWKTSGPVNTIEPKKPLYQLNPDLDPGQIKQVDWEAEGADVRVDRSVFRDGSILHEDTFFTHYETWRAVYEYGPGTDGIPTSDEED